MDFDEFIGFCCIFARLHSITLLKLFKHRIKWLFYILWGVLKNFRSKIPKIEMIKICTSHILGYFDQFCDFRLGFWY